jgi:hypothetical protein
MRFARICCSSSLFMSLPAIYLACSSDSATSSPDSTDATTIPETGGDAAVDVTGDTSVGDAPSDVTDSAPEAEAEAAAPWTPLAIQSQLAFWLSPSSLQPADGGVPQWKDLSGNGNDALQTTAGYQPAYTTNGIGGLPSATFNGPISFLLISDTPTMQWGTGDFSMFAVIRGAPGTIANFAMIYQKTGPGPNYNGFDFYVNSAKPTASKLAAAQVSGTVYVDNIPPPSTFIDSTVHLLGGRRAGSTLEIRVDGVSSNTLTSDAGLVNADISAVGSKAAIGQNGGGSPPGAENQQFHGDIAEIIATRGALADADVAHIEQYLKAKYAIP